MEYLDFEQPIKDLMEQYEKCELVGKESGVDVSESCKQIEDKILKTKKKIYGNLTPWQRVQLSRHPDRPYTLDYINGIADKDSFVELHGDRCFADDPAMVGGLIKINGQWRIDSTEAKKASQNSKAPLHLATVIAKGEVNLRANPTTNSNSIGVVREGDWVDILETGTCTDSSAAIVISDEIYFGSGSKRTQLSKGMPIQIVNDNGSQIICRVNVNGRPENVRFAPNHLVKLYGTTWYKIAGNGATGWVYSNYISKQ